MLSMWIYAGAWTALVLIGTWMIAVNSLSPPIDVVTVADTWFKGFVVIAAFHIVAELRRGESRKNAPPRTDGKRDTGSDSSETQDTKDNEVGVQTQAQQHDQRSSFSRTDLIPIIVITLVGLCIILLLWAAVG